MAKKKVEKSKLGRPTKFSIAIKIALKELICRGLTDAEVCKTLEIDEETLRNWKKKYASFFGSKLRDWKLEADLKVEQALFKSALGGIVVEKKPMNVMTGDGMSAVEYHEYEKHIPANVSAQRYWLNNRKSSDWREKREFDITQVAKMSDEDLKKKALAIMEANSE